MIKKIIFKFIKATIGNIIENMAWFLGKFMDGRLSFAQCGEDIILRVLLEEVLNKKSYSYLDIGANDPKYFSNTYFMYRKNNRGILVEPNVKLCKKLKKVRKGDIVLNCGVDKQKGKSTYYFMDIDLLNTFSEEEAKKCVEYGNKIMCKKKINVVTINQILKRYGKVDLISIDVEGKDFEIMKTLDYSKFAPLVICMETQEYHGTKRRDFDEINAFLEKQGYMVYADTMLDTIYVKKNEYIKGLGMAHS